MGLGFCPSIDSVENHVEHFWLVVETYAQVKLDPFPNPLVGFFSCDFC